MYGCVILEILIKNLKKKDLMKKIDFVVYLDTKLIHNLEKIHIIKLNFI